MLNKARCAPSRESDRSAVRTRGRSSTRRSGSTETNASNTPDEMAVFLKNEQQRYGTIIRNANIKIEQ